MTGIHITIPTTADERDVEDVLARLGLHAVVPDNVIELDDEGDCWAVTSWIVEGLKIRTIDGVPQTCTVRHDKARLDA